MTTILVALLAAALTATILFGAANLQTARKLEQSQAREREAMERLVMARKEGFEVPEAPVPAQAVELDSDALAPELEKLVSDWEGEAAQAAQREVIKRHIALGKSPAEVLRYLTPATES